MSCKDCVHYEVCRFKTVEIDQFDGCKDFKDKSRYVEQKHGKWNEHKCTNCDGDYMDVTDADAYESWWKPNYCPHCGAKMDGKGDNNANS